MKEYGEYAENLQNLQNVAFISCPISVSEQTLKSAVKSLAKKIHKTDKKARVDFWDRNTYPNYDKEPIIRNCNAFVLILPNLTGMRYEISQLPPGCRKELQLALSSNRKIYIAINEDIDEFSFFVANISHNIIEAIYGTNYDIGIINTGIASTDKSMYIKKDKLSIKSYVKANNFVYDKRILLLI